MSRRIPVLVMCLALCNGPVFPKAHAEAPPGLLKPATSPTTTTTTTRTADGPAGRWSGAIKTPGTPLAFSIMLTRDLTGDGQTWSGTLDIPAQGAAGMALADLKVEGDQITFALANVPGNPRFQGTISGDTITGNFTQGGATIPFELKRGVELARLNRPQEPKPPLPYEARDVSFDSPAPGVTLAGTITMPKGEGPFPAVVLVSGSGAQNRDEEVFGHKPFLVLSDRLTRAGIAVLRYDDRGAGKSTGDAQTATTKDLSDDAEAAVRFLREQPKVRGDAVGIVGHSEGGLIGPMVAARSEDVAFIVMMAGPGVSGDQILVRQIRDGAVAEGSPAAMAEAAAERVGELVELIKSGADESAVRASLEALLRAQMNAAPDAPLPANAVEAMYQQFAGVWFRYFLSYDPAEALSKVEVPVLVLQGELDQQVNAQINVPAIEKALAHNGRVRVEVLPGLNHLFQPAKTGAGNEYAQIETTMDEQVPRLIAEWIKSAFP